MRKFLFAFLTLSILTIINSCGTAKVFVKPDTQFNRQMTITVTGKDDESGMRGELQYALSSNGFNVVSEAVAKNGLNLYSNGQINSNNFQIDSQLYKSIELKSLYALNSNYNWTFNGFTYRILNFHAEVVNLLTGEVVMNINFRGDRTPNGVAKQVMEELNKKMK